MDQGRSSFDKYKVPKKKNADVLENLSEDSETRKELINKITDSFKRPDKSKTSMKFLKSWSINVSQSSYYKKRSMMKGKDNQVVESIGFLYLKSESHLNDIVKIGKLEIGNNTESHFGNCKLGVSVSQHADVCHSDFPNSGIILLVKYFKGKVNHLPFEKHNSCDLDPNHDSHATKDKLSIDSSTTTNQVFQWTQVIIYEYTEDVEIVKYPSQVLLHGAVQFSWHGPPLFRDLNKKDNVLSNNNNISKKSNKRPIDAHSETPPVKRSHLSIPISNTEQTTKQVVSEREMLLSTLVLGKSLISDSSLNLNIALISRLKERIVISNIMNQNWNLCELLQNKTFENYLSYKENNVEKHVHLSPYIINNLPGNINNRKKLGATFRPKYAMHFTMNPVSYKDKKLMLKVIERLKSKNMVGVVRCNTLCNILFYIFPSGPISEITGVSLHDTNCNLHVVIFTEQHPQFLPCNYTPQDKNLKKEQKLFQDVLSDYEAMLNTKSTQKPVILIDVLRNAILDHKNKLSNEQPNKILKFPSANQNSIEVRNDDSDMEIDSNCGSDFDSSSCNKSKNHIEEALNSKDTNNLSNKTQIVEQSTSQLNYSNNEYLVKSPDFIASNSNSLMIYPSNSSRLSLPVTTLSNGTSTPPLLSTQVSNSPVQFNGQFRLVTLQKLQKPYSREISEYNSRSQRRPIYLDSKIFEKTSDYKHLSIYKGEF